MKIKTAKQIKDELIEYKNYVNMAWVLVDDIHIKIARILTIPDEQEMFKQFFELQKELLKWKGIM